MEFQEDINYQRIAKAIDFINQNFKKQPSLEEIAEKIQLSPFHFQRLFTEWAGTSPKKFLKYISVSHAKSLLKDEQATLFDTAYEIGLSGTSRLHDLFISIEGMTPAEYKNGGQYLFINYSFQKSPFGNIIIASTLKGICYLAFVIDEEEGLMNLKNKFQNAVYFHQTDLMQQNALTIFNQEKNNLQNIKLHLKGTEFQLKIWQALLSIPFGKLSTYGTIGKKINNPKASRAIGTAIGNNPVSFLIPCHRVIQSTGMLSGYRWGTTRKTAIIGWEAAKVNT